MGVPFLLLECPGFTFAAAREFVANLDEELPKKKWSFVSEVVHVKFPEGKGWKKRRLSAISERPAEEAREAAGAAREHAAGEAVAAATAKAGAAAAISRRGQRSGAGHTARHPYPRDPRGLR